MSRLLGEITSSPDDDDRLQMEIHLRHTLEQAMQAGVVAWDPEGRIVHVNDSFCQMVGWSAEELIGSTPPFPYWPPEQLERCRAALDHALSGRSRPEGHELLFVRESGARFHVRVRFAELDLTSERTVYLGVVTDIDASARALKDLRSSELVYRVIGESLAYGVWTCDPEGRHTYVSPSFLRLMGLSEQECEQLSWVDLLHPDEVEATVEAWAECVKEGTYWEREHRYRGTDGQWHSILARGVPIRDDDGRIVKWVGINLDIQGLKDVEQALRDSDRRKDEFIAVLAHELRNPLAPLRSSVELLTHDPDAEQLERVLPVMQRQVGHLVRLVDDLLEVNRITRGMSALHVRPVDLAEIVSAAVDSVVSAMNERGHRFELSMPAEPVRLEADAVRLTQALSNVLDNAIKYTPHGGHITLEVTRHGEGDAEEISLRVRDSGVGVDQEGLASMFDMFTRLDHVTPGLGIGLHLVRGILELHGGSVRAHSDGPSRGLEIELRLPCRRPAVQSRPVRVELPRTPSLRVLVVDDNEDAADTLSALLLHKGHRVTTVYGGASAVRELERTAHDVALVDVGMPGVSGYEVAATIRRKPGLRDLVLVAVTGWGREEDQARTEQAGFDAHLTKPVQLVEVMTTLERLCRHLWARRHH